MTKRFLVIDLEATCSQAPEAPIPRHVMETIEIGAVLLDPSFAPVGELQTFVRPVRTPRLTAFCTKLTSIRQADVDGAPTFPEAMEALARFLGDGERPRFCSWGDYDRHQLTQDAAYHRVALPLGAAHLNLKRRFSERLAEESAPHDLRSRKKYGMAGALRLRGLGLEGTHHRGIDDARNIARLVPFILGERANARRA